MGSVIGNDQLDELDEEATALTTTDPSLTASRHSGQRRSQANSLITAPLVTTPDWSVR